MPRRKQSTAVEAPKRLLHLSSTDFRVILAAMIAGRGGQSVQTNESEALHQELAIAFAYYRSDTHQRRQQLKPSELREDLQQIAKAAGAFARLLAKMPEAADAMARAARPELDQPSLVTHPTAPPLFQGSAVDIQGAAKRALASPPQHLLFVDDRRGNEPIARLLERLIRLWEQYTGTAPTFFADNQGYASGFVRFALSCCRVLEIPIASEPALSKRAERIYANLAEPKVARAQRPRGRTRRSTGHRVRNIGR